MRSKVQRKDSISRAASVTLALAVVFLLAVVATPWAQGQTYSVLYTFTGGADGNHPVAGLIRDAAGNLYGTTYRGGTPQVGTVFKVSKGGKETLLHTFLGHPDGAYPQAGLLRDAAGNLYGTTSIGGSHQCGTVFKLDTTGKETVLYNFCSVTRAEDGRNPSAGLIRDAAGNLDGTTLYGGSTACVWGNRGCGVVFKLDTTGNETVLYNFCSEKNCTDGAVPYASLIRDAAGNLYGTTYLGGSGGGSNNGGVVFKLDANGKETVLYNFCLEKNCTGGANPYAGLIRDAAGNLYGTAAGGGVNGC